MRDFKVGDKVYCPSRSTRVLTVRESKNPDYLICVYAGGISENFKTSKSGRFLNDKGIGLVHATSKNHRLLNELYGVEFEKPPLRGSELTKRLLAIGWDSVPCWVSNDSDEEARLYSFRDRGFMCHYSDNMGFQHYKLTPRTEESKEDYTDSREFFKYAVPFDPKTGKELTEEVLGE